MKLEDNIKTIKDFLLDRYRDNLAAILIFGSVNTGHFKDGKSDIDHMIFLKKLNGLNIENELKILYNKLKKYNFASQYFNDLDGIKNYIHKRKSFSTYITIVSKDGSKTVYTTPEFEKTRGYLKKHPMTKKEIREFIQEKDKFELEGYFRQIKGYDLTKALTSHLRRKLQILNYFKTRKLIFDNHTCLTNINLNKKEMEKLEKLYETYKKRQKLSNKEFDYYRDLAREFTEKIIQSKKILSIKI